MNYLPKLLLAADTFHPKVDGTLRFMEEFAKKAQKNFEISYLVPGLTKDNYPQTTAVKTSARIFLSGYPLMKFSWSNLQLIKKTVRNSDIIFVQGPALISYLSMYYGHKYHKTTVFYTHTIAWELFETFAPPPLNRWLNKLIKLFSVICYNYCNLVLVPYPGLQHYLRQAGVKPPLKIAKLGVDINLFNPTLDRVLSKKRIGIPANKLVIGYVGRISKEKNIKVLLEAFKSLKDQQQVYLLIVGDGPEEQTAKFKSLENCAITGFKQDVNNYLKAMDIFVMPSLTETTSLATLEAMATGLPVIVSKIGFIKDYVKKDYNGLFFPKNSAKILAAKLEKLLQDQTLREKLGRNARKTVIYSFSWERSINRIRKLILNCYNETLHPSRVAGH